MSNPSLQLLRPKTRLIFPHPISNLSLLPTSHIQSLSKPCYFHLQNGSRFWPLLTSFQLPSWSRHCLLSCGSPGWSPDWSPCSSPPLPQSPPRWRSIHMKARSCHSSAQNSPDASISQRKEVQTIETGHWVPHDQSLLPTLPSTKPYLSHVTTCPFLCSPLSNQLNPLTRLLYTPSLLLPWATALFLPLLLSQVFSWLTLSHSSSL